MEIQPQITPDLSGGLASLTDAAEFARVSLGWTPDPKQTLALQTGARNVILNCSRQWGKSTVAATKIVHKALSCPGTLSIIVAENLAQTAEVFQKIDGFLSHLDIQAKTERGKFIARFLPHCGSRIIGIAAREQAVRSYTADFVLIDEAARIPDPVIDSLLPVAAVKDADWWMASTPRGRRGRFYEMWEYSKPGPDQFKISAPASENPRIKPSFLQRVREERGDNYFRQEFGCEFIENGQYLMDSSQVRDICE